MRWTVLVGDRELPARTLVLEAAGAPPNDPTNSHQAVEILKRLGFETRYCKDEGDAEPSDTAEPGAPLAKSSAILELVSRVAQNVPENEWGRVPADLSKNLDHYLYGHKKADE